jgi:exosortase/archaeosortase family protein
MVRGVISLALAGLAALALHENGQIRVFEAWLASHVIPVGAGVRSGHQPGQPIVWFAANSPRWIGLDITPECTVGLLMIPFIAASALLVWQRVAIIRPVMGLAVALVMLITVNQLRLLDIVWFVHAMGFGTGFYWGHTLVGSLITILGLASSLAMFLVVTVRRRKLGPRRAAP